MAFSIHHTEHFNLGQNSAFSIHHTEHLALKQNSAFSIHITEHFVLEQNLAFSIRHTDHFVLRQNVAFSIHRTEHFVLEHSSEEKMKLNELGRHRLERQNPLRLAQNLHIKEISHLRAIAKHPKLWLVS